MGMFSLPLDNADAIAGRLRWSTACVMVLYLVDLVLSFVLSLVYQYSYVNLTFAFIGILLATGYFAARNKDLKMTGVFIALLSLVIALVLLGGTFTLISCYTTYKNYQVSKAVYPLYPTAPSVSLTQFSLLIVVLLIHPVLFLLDVSLLCLASRLRAFLRLEKSATREVEMQQKVMQHVEAIVKLMESEKSHSIPSPLSRSISTRRNSKPHIERQKSKDRGLASHPSNPHNKPHKTREEKFSSGPANEPSNAPGSAIL